MYLGLMASIVVAAIVAAMLVAREHGRALIAEQAAAVAEQPVSIQPAPKEADPPAEVGQTEPDVKAEPSVATPPPVPKPTAPRIVAPKPVAPPAVMDPPKVETPDPPSEEQLVDLVSQPPDVEKPERLTVPGEEAQRRITGQLMQIHDLNKRRTSEEKIKLAAELFAIGKNSENSDEKYVLLDKAAELAAEGSDPARALAIVDQLGATFEIDLLQAKVRVLENCATAATTPAAIGDLVKNADAVIDAALDEEQFDVAVDVAAEVYRACSKSCGKEFRKQALQRRKDVEDLAQRWKQIKQARAKLETSPDDPQANLMLGKYLCFEMGDWQQGLPHLAKGDDAELKQLAARDTSLPPADPNEQAKLGDAWWDLAQSRKGEEKAALAARAGYWYEQAVPKMPAGLAKSRIEKRMIQMMTVSKKPLLQSSRRKKELKEEFHACVLGIYGMKFMEKPHPIAFMGQPIRGLYTEQIRMAMLGKIDQSEINWSGKGYVYAPRDTEYLFVTKGFHVTIDGMFIGVSGTSAKDQRIKYPFTRGLHEIRLDTGSHGGKYIHSAHFMILDSNGNQVLIINRKSDIESFLAQSIDGKPLMELSGWKMSSKTRVKLPPTIFEVSVTAGEHLKNEHNVLLKGMGSNATRKDLPQKQGEASGRDVAGSENVALASNGTTMSGKFNNVDPSAYMIDGKTETKPGAGNYSAGKIPAEWIVQFKEAYRLREIRLKLWDGDNRFYRYAIAISGNGKKYEPLVDRSQGKWQGWQVIKFPKPRPVQFVKIFGLHCSKGDHFHVIEFEAYCVTPKQ